MNDQGAVIKKKRQVQLAEVWGDVVDVRHLLWAIIIGCAISLPAFLAASWLFTQFVPTPDLARTYALLVGLAGCLIAGAICAKLFPPKRVLKEEMSDVAAREEALAELAAETGDLGNIKDLPPAAVQELRDLGIYDLFANYTPPPEVSPYDTDDDADPKSPRRPAPPTQARRTAAANHETEEN